MTGMVPVHVNRCTFGPFKYWVLDLLQDTLIIRVVLQNIQHISYLAIQDFALKSLENRQEFFTFYSWKRGKTFQNLLPTTGQSGSVQAIQEGSGGIGDVQLMSSPGDGLYTFIRI